MSEWDGFRKFISTNITEPGAEVKPLTREDFDRMLEYVYATGGSPDFVYYNEAGIDRLWRIGALTLKEYAWLKLRFRLHWLGTWTRNAISGVRSALRTLGSRVTR